MNNKKLMQSVTKRRRRVLRAKKFFRIRKGTKTARSIQAFLGKRIGEGHAQGGGRSSASAANPVYAPPKGKYKGFMKDHKGNKIKK